jgi:hypothetical protein
MVGNAYIEMFPSPTAQLKASLCEWGAVNLLVELRVLH